jgi:hypothetical protein
LTKLSSACYSKNINWGGGTMADKDQYVTQEEATKQLGVTRATLYYYMKTLNIEGVKFDLDRHVYLRRFDFERIVALRAGAQERRRPPDEDISKVA